MKIFSETKPVESTGSDNIIEGFEPDTSTPEELDDLSLTPLYQILEGASKFEGDASLIPIETEDLSDPSLEEYVSWAHSAESMYDNLVNKEDDELTEKEQEILGKIAENLNDYSDFIRGILARESELDEELKDAA